MIGETTQITTNDIGGMADFINRYGFMVVFCATVMIIGCIFFWNLMKQTTKKNDNDVNILTKEREASLEQSKKMFDLVTTVQTEQVSQLQVMTNSLRAMNESLTRNGTNIEHLAFDLDKMAKDVDHIHKDNASINNLLDEILTCVKESSKYNLDILNKIGILETLMHSVHPDVYLHQPGASVSKPSYSTKNNSSYKTTTKTTSKKSSSKKNPPIEKESESDESDDSDEK